MIEWRSRPRKIPSAGAYLPQYTWTFTSTRVYGNVVPGSTKNIPSTVSWKGLCQNVILLARVIGFLSCPCARFRSLVTQASGLSIFSSGFACLFICLSADGLFTLQLWWLCTFNLRFINRANLSSEVVWSLKIIFIINNVLCRLFIHLVYSGAAVIHTTLHYTLSLMLLQVIKRKTVFWNEP